MSSPSAARCCRSCPRCTDCPVRTAAVTRALRRETATAALISEVLTGMAPRALPASVLRTLETLDDARRPTALAAR